MFRPVNLGQSQIWRLGSKKQEIGPQTSEIFMKIIFLSLWENNTTKILYLWNNSYFIIYNTYYCHIPVLPNDFFKQFIY